MLRKMHIRKLAEREGLPGAFFAALSCFARNPGLGILPRPAQREKGPLDLFLFRFATVPGPTGSLRSLKTAPGDFVEPKGSHAIPSTTLKQRGPNGPLCFRVAEREGFEPPDGCPSTVFKTAALNRSATSPKKRE